MAPQDSQAQENQLEALKANHEAETQCHRKAIGILDAEVRKLNESQPLSAKKAALIESYLNQMDDHERAIMRLDSSYDIELANIQGIDKLIADLDKLTKAMETEAERMVELTKKLQIGAAVLGFSASVAGAIDRAKK